MVDEIAVVGHRGWPTRFPDNTLSGFLAAAAVCEAVELDVRRSSDGKLVLAHDAEIGPFAVTAAPWSVLADVDLGGGHKPCLLDEAIAALPETSIFIEIKNTPGTPGYEPDSRLALEAASRARAGDVVISFNWAAMDLVRRNFPQVITGINVGSFGNIDDATQHCFDVGHTYMVPDIELLKPEMNRFSGLEVFVWSSQRGETFAGRVDELVSLGVSGIIADDPQLTRNLIGSNR